MAQKVGVNKSTVSKWEHEIAVPDVIKAVKMAQILDTSLDVIFDI